MRSTTSCTVTARRDQRMFMTSASHGVRVKLRISTNLVKQATQFIRRFDIRWYSFGSMSALTSVTWPSANTKFEPCECRLPNSHSSHTSQLGLDIAAPTNRHGASWPRKLIPYQVEGSFAAVRSPIRIV